MAGPLARCPNGHVFEFTNFMRIGPNSRAQIRITDSTVNCPDCGLQAKILDGDYTFTADAIRVVLSSTVTAEDRAAVQGFLSALQGMRDAPTPEELDTSFADVPSEVRDAVKALLESTDWSTVRRFIAWLLPAILAVYLSYGTDRKVEAVGNQVTELQHQVQDAGQQVLDLDAEIARLEREWQLQKSPQPAISPKPSPRANPKGTSPRTTPRERRRRPKH